jgi:nicotinate-nucleotide pyrophosphorylase (carboxylating)
MQGLLTPQYIAALVARCLAEDIGSGDITATLIDPATRVTGQLRVREHAVLCGTAWFDETFRQLDPSIRVDWRYRDGDVLPPDAIVCALAGSARGLLTGERTALNLLQTLSGTATETRRYVDALAGTGTQILDTRKTLPGLRLEQKYAVGCGGGTNHRIGLFDAYLVKENHIAAAGSISAAVRTARAQQPQALIEVEIESLEQLEEALHCGADRLLLDNFRLATLAEAVARRNRDAPQIELEASGGITLETIRQIAATGVNFVSTGAITKHVRAIDFSLRLNDV